MRSLKRWLHRNPSRILVEQFLRGCAGTLPSGSRVLDAGAGDCRYKAIFSRHRYMAADFAQVEHKRYGQIDVICDLRSIPLADGSFDAVICTQVLAHVPEPKEALAEMCRVLRPGGSLWLTCPLSFQENEQPYDFYRFTRFGLRHLMAAAGFAVRSVEPLEGYLATLQYHLGMAARNLPLSPSGYGGGFGGWVGAGTAAVTKPLFAACCVLYTWLELRSDVKVPGMNSNWAVVAEKPVLAGEAG